MDSNSIVDGTLTEILYDDEKIISEFTRLNNRLDGLQKFGALVEETKEGVFVYGSPKEAGRQLNLTQLKTPVYFKNRVLWEAEVPLNGYVYPLSVVKNLVPKMENKPLFLDHSDSCQTQAGFVMNLKIEGNKLFGDLKVIDEEAAKMVLSGAKWGFSPTFILATDKNQPNVVVDADPESGSFVINPAYDKTFLNNTMDFENQKYDKEKLMDYSIEQLRAIVQRLARDCPKEGYPKPKGEIDEFENKISELRGKISELENSNRELENSKTELEGVLAKKDEEIAKANEAINAIKKTELENKVKEFVSMKKEAGLVNNEVEEIQRLLEMDESLIDALIENEARLLEQIKSMTEVENTEEKIPVQNFSSESGKNLLSIEEQMVKEVLGR